MSAGLKKCHFSSFFRRDIHCFDRGLNEQHQVAQKLYSQPVDLSEAQLPYPNHHELGDYSEKEISSIVIVWVMVT